MLGLFLRELGDRGFPRDRPLLVVLDGAKGLRAAVHDVFGDVPVQRCQWGVSFTMLGCRAQNYAYSAA